jgi:diguanylate cyclase (GGDEF)-like protein
MELIKKSINFWVPAHFNGKPALKLRATVAVAILFFNLVICALVQIPILFFRSLPNNQFSRGHLICLVMLLCYYFALRYFKTHGSLKVASNTICVITYLIALFLSLSTGPFPSTLAALFVAPPMIAYLLEGRGAGNSWALVVLLTESIIGFASLALGYQALNIFGDTLPLFSVIYLVVITLMIVGAFSLSHHLNEQLQEALLEEKHRLEHLASHDPLTDLHNRRSFESVLESLTKPQQQRPFALMLLDINSFKHINDTKGHQAGDHVLKEFSQNLKQSVREFDFVARVGGDEFAVILNNLHDHSTTKNIIEKIVHRLQKNILIGEVPLQPRASIGIAQWPGISRNATDLYKKADEAMYKSKRGKKDYIISDADERGNRPGTSHSATDRYKNADEALYKSKQAIKDINLRDQDEGESRKQN